MEAVTITGIYKALTAVILLVEGIMDLKENHIFSFPVTVMLVLGIIVSDHPFIALAGTIISLLALPLLETGIGAGDIDALLLIAAAYGMFVVPIFFIAGCMGIGFSIRKKRKEIPLVFFLSIATVIVQTAIHIKQF